MPFSTTSPKNRRTSRYGGLVELNARHLLARPHAGMNVTPMQCIEGGNVMRRREQHAYYDATCSFLAITPASDDRNAVFSGASVTA